MSIDRLTRQFLSELSGSSIQWALLQTPPDNLGSWSDCDIASDKTGPGILLNLRPKMDRLGWYPIVHAHYDVGRADAIWIWSQSDWTIVHVDVLSDPTGMGRLGICTGQLLEQTILVDGLFVANEAWRTAYRISKDLSKRRPLSAGLRGLDLRSPPALSVFGDQTWADAGDNAARNAAEASMSHLRQRVMAGRLQRNGAGRMAKEWLNRGYGRVTKPAGRWIHLAGKSAGSAAAAVREQLEPALPVLVRELPNGVDLLCNRAIRLFRPGVFITYAEAGNALPAGRPDAFIQVVSDQQTVSDLMETISGQLANVTYRRIG